MRRIIHLLLITGILSVVPLVAEAAKPVYCRDAYQRCLSNCNILSGLAKSACDLGCGIAYLYCGS
jgi:hypothetical protein